MQNDQLSEVQIPAQENVFFKKLIEKLLSLWPWLLLSVSLCIFFQYLYLRYYTPEYKVHASILVQDDKRGGGRADESSVLEEFGILGGKSNVDNELEIFRSRSLMRRVVEDMQLFVRYYTPGKVRATEIFLNRPVNISFVDNVTDSFRLTGEYILDFDKNDSYRSAYTLTYRDSTYKGRIHDTLTLEQGRIVIEPLRALNERDTKQPLTIKIVPIATAVQEYMARLSVAVPNKQVSIINLTMDEYIPQKGEVILNNLIAAYLQANVNDKNQIADSTIRFIDDRLGLVFKELSGIEKDIEGFKTSNKLTDIGEQARLLLENTSEYSKQRTTQEVQLSVIEALQNFLKDNRNSDRVVPSSLVMQDPGFIALIQRYNELQLQRDRMLLGQTPSHPNITAVDEQLKTVRLDLLSSINSIKLGVQVSVDELKKRTSGFEKQIVGVPAKERVWLDYSRQQAIKQELYLFLLKKREETAISKSSTLANARIIDMAKAETFPFKPKKKSFLILGLMLGLIIPFAVSAGKDLFNTRVNSLENITTVTNVPVIAEIGHNIDKSDIVVTENARSFISEQFRSLRTNIKFLLASESEKVILITSSMSGEGKSFLSINLCAALGLAGKKVVLLELDLRKPRISEILKLKKIGITNYLVDANTDWRKWVQKLGEDGKFDVLSSGPLPPNPAELLMLPKMNNLISSLKEDYDYIIIDSAPVGLVTDAQILASMSDVTLFVIRHGLTFKQQIVLLDKLTKKSLLPRVNIIINDVPAKKIGYGYDAYGYHSYGYGFYEDNGKKS